MPNRVTYSRALILVCTLTTYVGISLAQPTGGTSGRSIPSNLRRQDYPQIDAGLRATFRLSAPNADHVLLDLGGQQEMTKGENGVWTITTEPLAPGFHYYA